MQRVAIEPDKASKLVKNDAGGASFEVTPEDRLKRFLILGARDGQGMVVKNFAPHHAVVVQQCMKALGPKTVDVIKAFSTTARTPKPEICIFALMVCAKQGDDETRKRAYAAFGDVCRTGAHVLTAARYVGVLAKPRQAPDGAYLMDAHDAPLPNNGWGSGTRKAFARWFTERDPDNLAFQLAKYQNRDGWRQADVILKSHPKPPTEDHARVLRWARGGDVEGELPPVLEGRALAFKAKSAKDLCKIIEEYKLPRECLPTEFLKDKLVWEHLLLGMPPHALLRNLSTLSRVGSLVEGSPVEAFVCDRIREGARMAKARVHPLDVLKAVMAYEAGHNVKLRKGLPKRRYRLAGDYEKGLTWPVSKAVVKALQSAFFNAFAYTEKTDRHYMLAYDVSGSMSQGKTPGLGGVLNLTPLIAEAALGLVFANVEDNVRHVAFSAAGYSEWDSPNGAGQYGRTGITSFELDPGWSIAQTIKKFKGFPMGSTDCALPILYATEHDISVDVFVVFTDNDTWAGDINAHEALRIYREKTGIPAKLAVVGMTSTNFTIADPNDRGSLDLVGFDSALPLLLTEFAKGEV